MALKTLDMDTKNYEEMSMELRNEFEVYLRLRPLWGEVVPRLFWYGACQQTSREILAIEYLPGEPLNVATADDKVKVATIKALNRIHELGVLHGDLRESNILVVGSKPFFIDFGFSILDGSEVNRAQEMAALRRLLEANRHD